MSEKKFSDLIAKVSDLSVTELSALTSKHRDLDAVSAELKRAADSVSAPDAKKRVYTLLAIISDLHFRERDDAQPYGPNVSWSDGRRSPIPEDLSDEQIALIWELLPSIQSPSLKGLLADLLWLEKRPSTRPHLKLIAETAMDSYIEAATYDLISDNDFELIRWLKRATRIARQIQADESIFEKIKEIYRQALGKESNCDKPGVLHRLYGPCGTKLAEIFGKDTLFDLQSLLVERSGPNLRNVVAHGKASVAMMYSGSSWYLFWLILRFCCIPLFQHWEKFEAAEQPLEVPDHD